jgi:hypothetical protein
MPPVARPPVPSLAMVPPVPIPPTPMPPTPDERMLSPLLQLAATHAHNTNPTTSAKFLTQNRHMPLSLPPATARRNRFLNLSGRQCMVSDDPTPQGRPAALSIGVDEDGQAKRLF